MSFESESYREYDCHISRNPWLAHAIHAWFFLLFFVLLFSSVKENLDKSFLWSAAFLETRWLNTFTPYHPLVQSDWHTIIFTTICTPEYISLQKWNHASFWFPYTVPAVIDATWQSLVLDADTPVLVEFWAPWCGPCRMIHPVINELAKQYTGKLKCYKVNTDESPSIATRYGIRSIPTVIIFKSGEKKEAIIGAVPKSTLTTSIEKFL